MTSSERLPAAKQEPPPKVKTEMISSNNLPTSLIREGRRIFLLADLYIDCWDAGRSGLHSEVGNAYLHSKGISEMRINEFWQTQISRALADHQPLYEIARLINENFTGKLSQAEFENLALEHTEDFVDRLPIGKGTLDGSEFRIKLYNHYIRYLKDCICYQDNKGFSDHSRLAEYLFHPNPTVGISIRANAPGAPKHREHIVPLRYMNSLILEMLMSGKTDAEAVSFLEKSLKIVIIHRDERHLLDVVKKWKIQMPTGWTVSDSVYARLEQANIEFVRIPPG